MAIVYFPNNSAIYIPTRTSFASIDCPRFIKKTFNTSLGEKQLKSIFSKFSKISFHTSICIPEFIGTKIHFVRGFIIGKPGILYPYRNSQDSSQIC